MEAMRNSWTDDRLDHLNLRVDEGFERMGNEFTRIDKRFDEGIERMDAEFARVDRRFDEGFQRMNQEFARVDKRLDELSVRMGNEFARVDKRFDKVEEAIVTLSGGIDCLRNVLLIGTLGLLGTVIAAAGAIVAAQ
jgi:predicted nuclease with TOPRIM domain